MGAKPARGNVVALDLAILRLIALAARDPELLPSDLIGAGMIGLECVLDPDQKKKAAGWKRTKAWNDESAKLDFTTIINYLLVAT